MKKFLDYLLSYIKEHFNLALYIPFIVFISTIIFLNYHFEYDSTITSEYYRKPAYLFIIALTQAIPYYLIVFLTVFITGRKINKPIEFFLKTTFFFFLMAFDRSFYQFKSLIEGLDYREYRFCYKVIQNGIWILTSLIPIAIYYSLFDKKNTPRMYGLTTKDVSFKPYLMMLGIMTPIIFIASLFPHFYDYYPIYKKTQGASWAQFNDLPEWVAMIIFEFFYITDFFSVELFFRGALVIGVLKHLGKDAILPMAASYVALHFGKPAMETISSAFGGYILGIIAYRSKNIWGGIFIHGGIAFLMEAFAFIQIIKH